MLKEIEELILDIHQRTGTPLERIAYIAGLLSKVAEIYLKCGAKCAKDGHKLPDSAAFMAVAKKYLRTENEEKAEPFAWIMQEYFTKGWKEEQL